MLPNTARVDLDQTIWTDYVNLRNQREVAERHDVDQSTVSRAISRYLATIPPQERAEYRQRALERLERLYQAHAERALTSTPAAALLTRVVELQARLLGLVDRREVEVSGTIEHEHTWQPGPTVAEVLEQWRERGWLRPQVELTRTDQETGP